MIGLEKALLDLRQKLSKNGVYTYAIDVPVTSGNMALLEEVASVMADELDVYECRCEPKTPESLASKCHACRNQDLIDRLRRLFEPVHRTINPDRLGSVSEAIYFRRWVKQQESQPGVNGGRGTLENVLSPTRVDRDDAWSKLHLGPVYTPPISQRDAEVAATLMQWLGTACGRGFVWECEREIAQATGERQQFDAVHSMRAQSRWTGGSPSNVLPSVENVAEHIADGIVPADKPQYRPLVERLESGFETFFQGLRREVQVVPSGDGWEPVAT